MVTTSNPKLKTFLIISGLGGLVGIATIVYRLMEGMKVTAMTSSVPWGMWVAFYIYFIGLSAGSFLFSTLIYVFGQRDIEKAGRLALVSAVMALVAGLFFVWIDLGHPWRMFNVFLHWNSSSVLAWEILFYVFYIIAILAEIWFIMRCDLARLVQRTSGFKQTLYRIFSLGWQCPDTAERAASCHRASLKATAIIGAIGVPMAIGVHGGTGAIFAVVKARPYWYSPIFPIIFLVSALVSGAGLMTFLYAFLGNKNEPDHKPIVQKLATWMTIFLGIDILLLIAEMLVGLYGNIPDHIAVLDQILKGPYWYVFWIGQLGFATLFPILIYIFKKESVNWLGFAGLLIVIGIVCVRFTLVIPAFVTPPIPHLNEAFNQFRFNFKYFPSLIEWISSFGIVSFVAFLFTLAYNFLPVYELAGSDSTIRRENDDQ